MIEYFRLNIQFRHRGGVGETIAIRVKLQKIRCRSKKYLTAEIAEYAEII